MYSKIRSNGLLKTIGLVQFKLNEARDYLFAWLSFRENLYRKQSSDDIIAVVCFHQFFFNRQTSVTANDGAWHHICLSWEKSSGSRKLYKDGVIKQEGTNFKRGHTIRQSGTLVLGQEQD